MMKESILRNVNVLNIVLAGVAVALLASAVVSWSSPPIPLRIEAKADLESFSPKAAREASPSLLDYAVIADQNLFHSERRVPPSKREDQTESRPEIVLYGILITMDSAAAYLEDKNSLFSTPGRGKRQRVLKKGEMLGGYVLREIYPDRIVMAKGEERINISLNDRSRKKSAPVAASAQIDSLPMIPQTVPGAPVMMPAAASVKMNPMARPIRPR